MGGIGSGRPSRPKEVKQLAGERPGRVNDAVPDLPKLKLDDVIRAPETLTDTAGAAEVWEYYAPGLARAQVLAEADVDMLAEFCKAVATARTASEYLASEGHVLLKQNGDAYVNPWHRIHKDAVNDMQRIAARFGLTPGDRARIVAPKPDDPAVNGKNPGRFLT